MIFTLTPIQAGVRELPPAPGECRQIDAELGEPTFPSACNNEALSI
jgi:hypothetical protein